MGTHARKDVPVGRSALHASSGSSRLQRLIQPTAGRGSFLLPCRVFSAPRLLFVSRSRLRRSPPLGGVSECVSAGAWRGRAHRVGGRRCATQGASAGIGIPAWSSAPAANVYASRIVRRLVFWVGPINAYEAACAAAKIRQFQARGRRTCTRIFEDEQRRNGGFARGPSNPATAGLVIEDGQVGNI